MIQQVSFHKHVRFTYTITDDQGKLLELVDVPVSYVHGTESGLLEKVEQALLGCEVGDRVSVKLTPEEAFGLHHPELTYTDNIENVPEQFRQVGAEVQMQSESGDVKNFVVTKIENGRLTIDGNHPLAGKNLTFTVEVRSIRDATPEEILQAQPVEDRLLH